MSFLDPKPLTSAVLDATTAAKINTPGSATATALIATILDQVATPGKAPRSALDVIIADKRSKQAIALTSWESQLAYSSTPRVLVRGHSVVYGTGAQAGTGRDFPSKLSAEIKSVSSGAVVTIKGDPGWTSTQFLGSVAADMPQPGPVGAVVFMGLLNDQYNNIPSATSKTNLQSILNYYRANNAGMPLSFVIVAEWARSGTYNEPWTNYVKAATEFADANTDVTLIDLSKRMGDVSPDLLDLFTNDGVHPNDAGHAVIYRAVASVLLSLQPLIVPAKAPRHIILPAILPPVASTNWYPALTGIGLRTSISSNSAEISYQFLAEAGRHDITFAHNMGPDRGQYTVYFNGVQAGGSFQFDGYAASAADAETTVNGYSLTAGTNIIRLVMATKNASSTGYIGSLRGLYITRFNA